MEPKSHVLLGFDSGNGSCVMAFTKSGMPVELKAQRTATCTKLLWHLVPKTSLQPQLSLEEEP